jgi:hypothetical protein
LGKRPSWCHHCTYHVFFLCLSIFCLCCHILILYFSFSVPLLFSFCLAIFCTCCVLCFSLFVPCLLSVFCYFLFISPFSFFAICRLFSDFLCLLSSFVSFGTSLDIFFFSCFSIFTLYDFCFLSLSLGFFLLYLRFYLYFRFTFVSFCSFVSILFAYFSFTFLFPLCCSVVILVRTNPDPVLLADSTHLQRRPELEICTVCVHFNLMHKIIQESALSFTSFCFVH